MRPRVVRATIAAFKSFAGWVIFRSRLYRLLLRGRAVIVVLHRVDDLLPDNPITSTTDRFENFVRFFAKYFEVVPLSELLGRLASGGVLGSTLTITFDDGYRESATVAAPILERYGLRGCFFVTTEFIGTDYVPPWDRERGIATAWMTWDMVRGLCAKGHEVGSHTATHVNLGAVTGEAARREIMAGKVRLEAELSESSGLFAYPYGGRNNMAEENKPLPKQLGLRCSVSAYGGTVEVGDDPFALKRTSITNWFVTPYHFGFDLVTSHLEES